MKTNTGVRAHKKFIIMQFWNPYTNELVNIYSISVSVVLLDKYCNKRPPCEKKRKWRMMNKRFKAISLSHEEERGRD